MGCTCLDGGSTFARETHLLFQKATYPQTLPKHQNRPPECGTCPAALNLFVPQICHLMLRFNASRQLLSVNSPRLQSDVYPPCKICANTQQAETACIKSTAHPMSSTKCTLPTAARSTVGTCTSTLHSTNAHLEFQTQATTSINLRNSTQNCTQPASQFAVFTRTTSTSAFHSAVRAPGNLKHPSSTSRDSSQVSFKGPLASKSASPGKHCLGRLGRAARVAPAPRMAQP